MCLQSWFTRLDSPVVIEIEVDHYHYFRWFICLAPFAVCLLNKAVRCGCAVDASSVEQQSAITAASSSFRAKVPVNVLPLFKNREIIGISLYGSGLQPESSGSILDLKNVILH